MDPRPDPRRLPGRLIGLAVAAVLTAATLGSGTALAAPGGQVAHGAAGGATGWFRGLAATRAATARFHRLAVAEAAGYSLFPGCFASPEGGMGVHYVNFDSVADGKVDPLAPEALVYEPRAHGKMKLVAVEWVVIASSWTGTRPPEVLGHPLTFVDSPNQFGLPPFYELHAWLWHFNPLGMFYEWNPRVSCAAG